MPKSPQYTLIWSWDHSVYELFIHSQREQHFHPEDDEVWLNWLAKETSFAFQGRSGRLNVYKEERIRGGQYWYAYHTNKNRTRKRYLGQTPNVTLARLEEAAKALNREPSPTLIKPVLPRQEAEAEPNAAPFTAEREAGEQMVLLSTKFSQPRLPSALVARERLLSLLDGTRARRLTLLAASGGWGKTTLLSVWASLHLNQVAWLALDALDNDLQRFWTSVIVALQHNEICPPIGGLSAIKQLHSPQPLTTILTTLLNEVEAWEGEIILMLDDYHVIEEQAIHDSLLFLLEHLPINLHLVLSSRVDPPWPLSRLRVRGQMLELHDEDLRFTEEEAAHFLRHVMALSLSEAQVAFLAQRTEGWIAGLQLAALTMQKREDLSTFVRGFTGSHRYLLDYVQEDILASQPGTLQDFLLHIAILSRISAPLCQAVTNESTIQASQQMLERIERANLFLVPLDEERCWYRLHDLFREALLARLHATQPERVPLLHQRAARWYEARGLLAEAIAHALEAQDETYAADLLERFIVPQSWRNEYHILRRWLARLPSDVFTARPDLSLQYAYATILTSPRGLQMSELVTASLNLAEQGYRATDNLEGLGAVEAFRAVLLSFKGDFVHAFALARQALTRLPEQSRLWRGHALSLLGAEAVLSGQMGQGSQLLRQGLALYTIAGTLPGTQFATALLGEVSFSQGKLQEAAHIFRQVFTVPGEQQELSRNQLTLETGAREIYYERLALYGLAALAYEWNNLSEVERTLQEALSQGQQAWVHILTPGLLLQVRLFAARGEMQQAQAFLSERAAREQQPGVLREIQFCQAWLALKRGDLARTQQWAETLFPEAEPYPLSRREEEILLLARLRIAEGQPGVALNMLASWAREAHIETRKHSALQILLLEIVAYEASGAQAQAKEAVLQACKLARIEGYQRIFLDEGERVEALLKALVREPHDEALIAFMRTLLRAFASTRAASSVFLSEDASRLSEPLTPQERRVLRQLADGASNQEIADQFVISLTTAKKHVANILSKLGAQNRTQAVALAREYALL